MDGLDEGFQGSVHLERGGCTKTFAQGDLPESRPRIQNPDEQLFAPQRIRRCLFRPSEYGLRGKEVGRRVRGALRDVEMEEYGGKSIHNLSYRPEEEDLHRGTPCDGHEILLPYSRPRSRPHG